MGISPEQWARVKEIYEAALESSPQQRATFVGKQTKDEVVRSEVLRLLSENDSVGSFLSTPPFVDQRNIQTESAERLPEGKVLAGRFRIIGFIAAGGMGEVYKAQDTRLDRFVVLKFLPKELAEDQLSLDRFRQEAKASSALNHPNICTVYDLCEDAGRAFIAMEYLEGETLSTRLKNGPLAMADALRVSREISSALGAAHSKGIIHRDLKPGNIMLTDRGAKLLDFGLARYERPAISVGDADRFVTDEAAVIGTPSYMSPEQLRGKEVDARTDIFGFGAVLYEMLTGRRAFRRRSKRGVIVADNGEERKPLRELLKDVPGELEHVVQRCLRDNPGERYNAIAEVERELGDCAELVESSSGINRRLLFRRARRPAVAIPLLLALVALAGLAAWRIHYNSKVNWARSQALPGIAQLFEQNKNAAAYALAVEAERYIPKDPVLLKLWPDISWTTSISTNPSGVSVYRRRYDAAQDAPWESVGITPIAKLRLPQVDLRWKFEKAGFGTVERAFMGGDKMFVTMSDQVKVPPGMVFVQLTDTDAQTRPVGLVGLPGFESLPPVPLSNFWIDKFEVSNAEFKHFVDQGGYQKQEFWKKEFRRNGQAVSWAAAMKLFKDKTARAGPALWSHGNYPPGQANFPVTGVSWFEAAAYAEFAGKSLPTIYHWRVAAAPWQSASIIPISNFNAKGPAPVGSYRGMSWFGAFDMAGNVKEWVWNETSTDIRYVLGGAWDDPPYMFYDPDTRSPFTRSSNIGFRCAKYVLPPESTKALGPVVREVRDFSSEQPVSDQIFQAYARLYSYDKTPLNAAIESSEEQELWKREKVTYDAAYGKERIIANLYLPKNASPPYQTVVYFPGAEALYERSSANDQVGAFDFVIKSGRAVLSPVYKSTYERGDNYDRTKKNTSMYRDHVVMWSKDLGRSIDYLQSRADIDHERFAFEGLSWGATMGALLPAVEHRFRALVLVNPGFFLQKVYPEADQLNFAPRVTAPVLMLDGQYDFYFPVTSSQEPMYKFLGTATEHKRRVLYDTSHDIPRNEMIKETLGWLDRYLGPVK